MPDCSDRLGLYGTTLAIKDNIHAAGFPTTCGSRFFVDVPKYDPLLVGRLRSAGATVIGKTNLGEFALDATTQNPHFGGAANPWDVSRTPGGSSGGSAVALAAGLADIALGTDSGGSVRIPAALCGIAAYRPTGAQWSTAGIVGAAWSVDSYGIMAKTAADIDYALQASALRPGGSREAGRHVSDRTNSGRIAYLADDSMGAVEPHVWRQYSQAIEALQTAGHDLTPISLPGLKDAPYACAVIAYCEVATWHRDSVVARSEEYGSAIHPLLVLGNSFRASEYFTAQRFRPKLFERFREMTEEFDFVMTPCAPMTAPRRDMPSALQEDEGDLALFAYIRFTCFVNLIDVPSVAIPCGLAEDGLPAGLQLLGRAHSDAGVLDLAKRIESVINEAFHTELELNKIADSWR